MKKRKQEKKSTERQMLNLFGGKSLESKQDKPQPSPQEDTELQSEEKNMPSKAGNSEGADVVTKEGNTDVDTDGQLFMLEEESTAKIDIEKKSPNQIETLMEMQAKLDAQLQRCSKLLKISGNLDFEAIFEAFEDGCRQLENQLESGSAKVKDLTKAYHDIKYRSREVEIDGRILEEKIKKVQRKVDINIAKNQEKEKKLEAILEEYEKNEKKITHNIISLRTLIDQKAKSVTNLTKLEKETIKECTRDMNAYLKGVKQTKSVPEMISKMKEILFAEHSKQSQENRPKKDPVTGKIDDSAKTENAGEELQAGHLKNAAVLENIGPEKVTENVEIIDVEQVEEPTAADVEQVEELAAADVEQVEEPAAADVEQVEEPTTGDVEQVEEPTTGDVEQVEETTVPQNEAEEEKPKNEQISDKEKEKTVRQLSDDIQFITKMIDLCKKENTPIKYNQEQVKRIHEIIERHDMDVPIGETYGQHELKLIITPLNDLRMELFMDL